MVVCQGVVGYGAQEEVGVFAVVVHAWGFVRATSRVGNWIFCQMCLGEIGMGENV